MLLTLAKKTLDIYTAPARFAIRQSRRNIALARQFVDELKGFQSEINHLADELIHEARKNMEIDPDALTEKQREAAARIALNQAEQGLRTALAETLKALVLLTATNTKALPGNSNSKQRSGGEIIEGDYQRVT